MMSTKCVCTQVLGKFIVLNNSAVAFPVMLQGLRLYTPFTKGMLTSIRVHCKSLLLHNMFKVRNLTLYLVLFIILGHFCLQS